MLSISSLDGGTLPWEPSNFLPWTQALHVWFERELRNLHQYPFHWMQALYGWSLSLTIYIKNFSLDASPPWMEPELCNLHQNSFTGCKPSMVGARALQFTSKPLPRMQALHGWSPSFAIYIKIPPLDASPPWLEPELCNLHQNPFAGCKPSIRLEPELCNVHQNFFTGCKPSMVGARALQFTSKLFHWTQALHGWSPSFAIYIKISSLDARPLRLEPELCNVHRKNLFIGGKPSMVKLRYFYQKIFTECKPSIIGAELCNFLFRPHSNL